MPAGGAPGAAGVKRLSRPSRPARRGVGPRGRGPTPHRAPWVSPALFLAAVFLAAAGLYHVRAFCHDDAFITLRYVHRLVSGLGLTWSDGEHVEGFTHPLWLGQLALLHGLGADPVSAARALGLTYVAALFMLWWRARARPTALLLVATQPGFVLWARGGLETASVCFWMTAGAWLTLLARERAQAADTRATRTAALAGAALAAAALTRPEGIATGLIALLWISRARRPRAALAAAALFIVPVAAYEAFRLAYFGDFLSNSARVKIGGLPLDWQLQSGVYYLSHQWTSWLPGVAAAALALALTASTRSLLVFALALPVWISLLLGGGDHMPGARLVVPATVLAAFAVAIHDRPAGLRSLVAALLVCAGAVWQAATTFAPPPARDSALAVGAPVGRYLETHLPAGALVATATAGSTPYFAPSLRFIDLLGLNDREIANRRIDGIQTNLQAMPGHTKGDGAYVLRRAPDVIILGPAEGFLGGNPRAWFLTDFELLLSPEFRTRYQPYGFPVSVTSEESAHPRVVAMLDASGRAFPLIAFLRVGSTAAGRLAISGTPLIPPWSAPAR